MIEQLQSPPSLDLGPEWIAARRDHVVRLISADAPLADRAPRRPSRPSWRVVAIALAVVLLGTGAAIAATGFDILDWFRSDNPSETAFSIDTDRVVSGPVPDSVECADVGADGTFACTPGRGRWTYVFYNRVEAQPEFSREAALNAVAVAERAGSLTHEAADQARADFDAVGDEFFNRINLLLTVTTISSPHQVRPGVLLVPPANVPQFVTCERAGGSTYECRNLAASVVPVGAPIYGLVENDEWVEQRFEPEGSRDVTALYEGLFGRPLTPAEERLVILLGTAGKAESGVDSEGAVEEAPPVP